MMPIDTIIYNIYTMHNIKENMNKASFAEQSLVVNQFHGVYWLLRNLR